MPSQIPPRSESQPIAICGLGCRLPGGVRSPSDLWSMLAENRSVQCSIPKNRFNIDAFYHPRGLDRPGSVNTHGGYFLQDEDIRQFDNSFFGINNLEATYMDPEQRKLLEVVFECLESAGESLDSISGSNTGCYVGNFSMDFQMMQVKDPEYLNRYSATGMGTTILASRISHVFNMVGPCCVLDTACSSSLYCLHMACVALENGECDAAIVAGANLVQSPEQHLATMKTGVLSPTSTCHTFDSEADGYGRADGVGALYIKRLEDAIRDGDTIRSVIRGSAVNANGRTTGIALPTAEGQEAVIRKAYAKSGLNPSDTTYVECHGTGTSVGDAIEVDALSRAFPHTEESPLLIGSVKTNVGHSEAASGITSVIKCTLALEHGEIPGTFGLKNRNPKLSQSGIAIPTHMTPWPTANVRRTSINSFGYGGSNAHVILEDARPYLQLQAAHQTASGLSSSINRPTLLPFSATTTLSLEARVDDICKSSGSNDIDLADLAHTLGSRRSHLAKRGYIVVPPATPLSQRLVATNLRTVPTDPGTEYQTCYVFSGQGAQWPEMGKELFHSFPVFHNAILEMDSILQTLPHAPQWKIEDVLLGNDDTYSIHDPLLSQPVCTALQVALARLLASWDIYPDATIGHSSGEVGAAFAAGFLSAAESITIAYYRGYVAAKLSSGEMGRKGAMIAVGMSQETAQAHLVEHDLLDRIQVACVNSPQSVTLSGDEDAIGHLALLLQEQSVFNRKLVTSGMAYHSHHMRSVGKEYEELLEQALPSLDPSSFRMDRGAKFVSSVTVDEHTQFDPSYWRRNLEQPTLFAPAMAKLLQSPANRTFHVIELGPHSTMQLPIKQIREVSGVKDQNLIYAAALKRFESTSASVQSLAGFLWLHGRNIPFDEVNGLQSRKGSNSPQLIHDLPPYRWDYKNLFWNESRFSSEFRMRTFPRHELLGSLMLGGNGLDPVWRNVLRLPDIPWLQDHKWEQTVVFPGVCYMSMAIEAVRQASGIPWADRPSFELRNVHFIAALVLPTGPGASVELFTTLHPTSLTYTTDSGSSWEFRVSSWADGVATTHARGSITLRGKIQPTDKRNPLIEAPAETALDSITPDSWYNRLMMVCANYGPAFRSLQDLQVPRTRKGQFCAAAVPLNPGLGDHEDDYLIHPITLDAMLQVCNIAATSGVTEGLWAKVPTKVGFAVLHTPEGPVTSQTEKASLVSSAKTVGFGTALTCVEMKTASGQICGSMRGVRFAPYNKGSSVDENGNRHPMLRVTWKPDVLGLGLISPMYLNQLVASFADGPMKTPADGMAEMLGLLDLVAHKRPDLRVLELVNGESDATSHILDTLDVGSGFMRLKSYIVGSWSQDSELVGHSVRLPSGEPSPRQLIDTNERFDLLVIPRKTDMEQISAVVTKHLHPNGVVLGCRNSEGKNPPGLATVEYPLKGESGHLVLGQYTPSGLASARSTGTEYLIVEHAASPLGEALMKSWQINYQIQASRVQFDDLSSRPIPSGCTVFFLVECQRSLLATATADELDRVKLLTDNASQLVWITCGNLLSGSSPDMALVNGLSRAVMSEQPALEFFTYDIDTLPSTPSEALATAEHLIALIHQTSVTDFEFKQRNGVPTVSRFAPDDELNGSFRSKQGHGPVEMTLEAAQPIQLNIARPGQLDTLYFDQLEGEVALGPTDVQVQVKMVGLNAKDFYTVAGKVDTDEGTSCLEYSGIVHKVGADVARVAPGDRVVVMAPSPFKTVQVVPEWACARLLAGEELPVMSSMPIVYSTALYALHHRARIQPGESILIHSGAGGVGMAAIEVALMAGAKVYTTVSSEEKREYLIRTFNLSPGSIFSSRDTSFLHDILEATHGKGVDVILNSLTGDLLHASWKACAPFGRFVEIGKLDFTDAGKLEMEHFLKNITFTAFDLTGLYNTPVAAYNQTWTSLLDQTLRLYRQGRIHGIRPLEVFDISDLTQALRYFSSRNRMGKIAISLENPSSSILVQRSKYQSTFNPDKVYVMVGCLGGLGRSISRWMVARGARRFTFLSRSGLRKPAAQELVNELESTGAHCTIHEGDVSNEADVFRVITSIQEPIGGVIQAAMGLSESLFSSMTHSAWHTGLSPKVQGTWNLHNALSTAQKEHELDFFLLTSSISGTVGAATESNYCAANAFLDNFARYRRSRGLSATAVALGRISEVGYLHENPEVEAMFERKGIHPITQEELLQVIDIALHSSAPSPSQASHSLEHAQILTGLEPFALHDLRKRGFEASANPLLTDQRAAILAEAVNVNDSSSSNTPVGSNGQGENEIEASIAQALQANGAGAQQLEQTVLHHITKQFGNLILLPAADVDVAKPLTKYGVDSMLAAELRAWFFKSFKVDIPFLTLLSKTCTVQSLGDIVVGQLRGPTKSDV